MTDKHRLRARPKAGQRLLIRLGTQDDAPLRLDAEDLVLNSVAVDGVAVDSARISCVPSFPPLHIFA